MIRRTGRQICLAENNGAALTYPGDRGGVSRRPIVAQLLKSARRRHANDLERILDGHGDAVQRTEIDATREGIVRQTRLLARPLFVERDDRVVSRIELLDPCQM